MMRKLLLAGTLLLAGCMSFIPPSNPSVALSPCYTRMSQVDIAQKLRESGNAVSLVAIDQVVFPGSNYEHYWCRVVFNYGPFFGSKQQSVAYFSVINNNVISGYPISETEYNNKVAAEREQEEAQAEAARKAAAEQKAREEAARHPTPEQLEQQQQARAMLQLWLLQQQHEEATCSLWWRDQYGRRTCVLHDPYRQ